jgi:hypothetical protein
VRLAAERAEAEERARGEEAAARLKRELKRLEQRAAQFDARVENLRAEKDAAVAEERSRREKEEEKADESKASLALARRASDGMLLATRSLATRLLRLSAAVGHTVGAAARESRRRAGPTEAGIAALVDFEPDEVADLLGADDEDEGDPSAVPNPRRATATSGRAADPASFAALVAETETRADAVAAALARGGTSSGGSGAEGSSSSGDAAEEALRWIVDAVEAEAEHAESALKSAVPAMTEWWIGALSEGRGRGRGGSGARGGVPGRRGGRAARGEGASGTRAKLEGAAALLASSDESEAERPEEGAAPPR